MLKEGGQTASTSFNIRDNKRNVEQMLKQSLNAFKLIQQQLTSIQQFSTRFQGGGKRFRHWITLLFNKIEWMLKPFARGFRNNT